MSTHWSKKDLKALALIAKCECETNVCEGCRFDSPWAGCLLIVNKTGKPKDLAKEMLETALKEIIETK